MDKFIGIPRWGFPVPPRPPVLGGIKGNPSISTGNMNEIASRME